MKDKKPKLYNVIFPIWVLWLFPLSWIIVLPANFLIDLAVIAITLKCMRAENIRRTSLSVIWRVWVIGFISDFIGTAIMFSVNFINFSGDTESQKWLINNFINPVNYNAFENVWSFLWVLACVIITAGLIFVFNLKFGLKSSSLTNNERKKLALSLAVFTAPYLFFLPTTLFI